MHIVASSAIVILIGSRRLTEPLRRKRAPITATVYQMKKTEKFNPLEIAKVVWKFVIVLKMHAPRNTMMSGYFAPDPKISRKASFSPPDNASDFFGS